MTDLVTIAHVLLTHTGHLLGDGSTTTTTLTPAQQIAKAAQTASSGGGSALTPVAVPLAWVLAGIYAVIPNYGVAIMGLSLIWMILISPLTLKSTRSMLAMQRLQPELKKLQAQHKDDRQAFAQAQMDLFREHNVSPFGSCIPMLLPLPVFFALFRVIDGLSTLYTVAGTNTTVATPKFLDPGTKMYKDIVASHGNLEAFGMNLANSPLSHHAGFFAAAPYWIAILIMASTSYLQTSMMQARNQSAAMANPQMRMMKYLAPLFALFCIRFPVGVIVYYATSNVARILQQYLMYRYDPKVKALVVKDVAEIEEHTHEIDERERNRPGYTPPRGAKPPASEKRPAPNRPAGKGAQSQPAGKSRFRDLLAQAQEQAEAKRAASASDKARGAPNRNAGTNGSSNGNGTARKPKPQPGSRTNRKRKGR